MLNIAVLQQIVCIGVGIFYPFVPIIFLVFLTNHPNIKWKSAAKQRLTHSYARAAGEPNQFRWLVPSTRLRGKCAKKTVSMRNSLQPVPDIHFEHNLFLILAFN